MNASWCIDGVLDSLVLYDSGVVTELFPYDVYFELFASAMRSGSRAHASESEGPSE